MSRALTLRDLRELVARIPTELDTMPVMVSCSSRDTQGFPSVREGELEHVYWDGHEAVRVVGR